MAEQHTTTAIWDDAFAAIEAGELGTAVAAVRSVLTAFPYLPGADALETIENDYRRMLGFMKQGYQDPQREQLYGQLLRRVFRLLSDVDLSWRKRNLSLYADTQQLAKGLSLSYDFIRSVLEGFVTDVTMLSLEPEEVRLPRLQELHDRHQTFMSRLFAAVWTSGQWSDADRQFYEELLLLPTIDSMDIQLLVSGVTIAAIQQFDVNKLRVLIHVYLRSADTRVRQRALVGWTFALPKAQMGCFPELTETIAELLQQEAVRRELLELQIQVFYCMNAEKDHQEIQRDIMPTLLKHNNLRVTRFGIEEKEEDPLQDILHPDAADKAMEEVEASIQKMMSMQKAGSDIYFGGFSQMKRFPFFASMSNWLVPFYREHPALRQVEAKMRDNRFMELLFSMGPFCDSDKYSLAFALSSVVDRLPASMREMLNSEEAISPQLSDDLRSPAYVRRMYLQDLYRFYKVYPRRNDLRNPFGLFVASEYFGGAAMEQCRLEVGKFLMKQGRWSELEALLVSFQTETPDHADYDLLAAYADMYEGLYESACYYFGRVLERMPEDTRALKGMARCSLMYENYERAEEAYEQLTELYPQSKSHALNRAVCLLKLDRVDDAVAILYRLDYEHPQDLNIRRALAWGLLCQDRTDVAVKEYDKLLREETPAPEDYLNAGYCYWLMNRTAAAVEMFSKYVALSGEEALLDEFKKDMPLLESHGISSVDVRMMRDMSAMSL